MKGPLLALGVLLLAAPQSDDPKQFAEAFSKLGRAPAADARGCVACHLGMNDPTMSAVRRAGALEFRDMALQESAAKIWPDAAERRRMIRVFMSHPKPDMLGGPQSPHASMSCETCHVSTDRRFDSFHPVVRQMPMRPIRAIESICLKCHLGEEPLSGTARLNRGKVIFDRFACYACHPVPGMRTQEKDLAPGEKRMRKPAPPLEVISNKVDKRWAFNFILHPPAFKPTARMPAFFPRPDLPPEISGKTTPEHKTAIERIVAGCLAEYVFSLSRPLKMIEIPDGLMETAERKLIDQRRRGRGLVLDLGCLGCHKIDENYPAGFQTKRGFLEEEFATNLFGSGTKFDSPLGRRWLYNWLKKPSHYFPDTSMPELRVTDQEAADIVQFLVTLKVDNASRKEAGLKPWTPAESPIESMTPETEKILDELVAYRKGDAQAPAAEKVLWYGKEMVSVFACYACHALPGEWSTKSVPGAAVHRGINLGRDFREHKQMLEPSANEYFLASVYLFGQVEAIDAPPKAPTPRMRALAEGERIMAKFNCEGCHVVDELKIWMHDEGRVIRVNAWYKTTLEKGADYPRPQWCVEWLRDPATLDYDPVSARYPYRFPEEFVDRWEPARGGLFQNRRLDFADSEEKALLAYRFPPPLRTVGRKLNPEWLKGFLKAPIRMRSTRTRMPTFNFKPGEIDALVEYFRVRDGAAPEDAEEKMTQAQVDSDYARLLKADRVLRTDCFGCHTVEGVGGNRGPELANGHARFQKPWLRAIMANPAAIYPRTAMPDMPMGSDLDAMIDLVFNYDKFRSAKVRLGKLKEVQEALNSAELDVGELSRLALERAAKDGSIEKAIGPAMTIALDRSLPFRKEFEALLAHASAAVRGSAIVALLRIRAAESLPKILDGLKGADVRVVQDALNRMNSAETLKRQVEPGVHTVAEWLRSIEAATEMNVDGAITIRTGDVAALMSEISNRTGGVFVTREDKLLLIPLDEAVKGLLSGK